LREHAGIAIRHLNGTKLDERVVRLDWDPGFREGRQYGRGKSGGQVITSFESSRWDAKDEQKKLILYPFARFEMSIAKSMTLDEVAGHLKLTGGGLEVEAAAATIITMIVGEATVIEVMVIGHTRAGKEEEMVRVLLLFLGFPLPHLN
jgi:hypothetical protein